MPHLTARDLSRVAHNPRCQLQAALPLLHLRDEQAFQFLTGRRYRGPRGERTAALAWGRLFESRLTEHQARRLLGALDDMLGIPVTAAQIRDLRIEVPDSKEGAITTRTVRTREVLAALLDGRPVPDLIIQPSLVLSWGGAEWGYIAPDALILDRRRGGYVPVETKAFIALDGIITPGERTVLRLQAAVEILALRSEMAALDPMAKVPPQALLVVASPYGFRPQPAVLEELDAELAAVEAALATLARVFAGLAVHRSVPLRDRLLGLPIHLQDSCLVGCALAGVCRSRALQLRASFGDDVAARLGERVDLARLIALLSGEAPATPEEAGLQEALEEAITLHQWR